jgi:hypothetical protein
MKSLYPLVGRPSSLNPFHCPSDKEPMYRLFVWWRMLPIHLSVSVWRTALKPVNWNFEGLDNWIEPACKLLRGRLHPFFEHADVV